MNKGRRAKLKALNEKLAALQCELEELRDEEQEYFDNMPEAIQGSERGEKADGTIGLLDNAASSIGDAMTEIGEAIEL